MPGEVVDVYQGRSGVRVTVRTAEPSVVGDKIANRYGNKGVISAIIPDEEMLKDEAGNPVDLVYSPLSVPSRVNPAQILEMALGKIAAKTGKPYAVAPFEHKNAVKWVKEELAKHGVSDRETLYDPDTGRRIPNVAVGKQYIMKLFKSTATNYSARGVGDSYDVNQQPTRGGATGSKALGAMELSALLSHNARNLVDEAINVRGQRNDDFWRAVMLGLPPPAPRTPFTYDKFGALLAGAGIKLDKTDSAVRVGPLTDRDVSALSSGPVENPLIVRSKDLQPEVGGLFDPARTGGLQGTKWAHIDLSEPVLNPVFKDPVRHLLGLTGTELESRFSEVGGGALRRELSKIDLESRRKELLSRVKVETGSKLDGAVKQLKYIRALKEMNKSPAEAYMLRKVPVIPPIFRPILPAQGGQILVNDANYLYRDLMFANDMLRNAATEDERKKARTETYAALGALTGVRDPTSEQLKARGVKGFLPQLGGPPLRSGFIQGRMLRRNQDLSGRGTIAPDPGLGMDEVGLPEDMMWTIYSPFILRRMVTHGYRPLEAKKLVEDRSPLARDFMLQEGAERPVLVNRAPTLHKHNLVAAYPRPVGGLTIRINEFMAKGMGGDYDGDAMQVHVPATRRGAEEARRITLSNLLFSDRERGRLMVTPEHDAAAGLHMLSTPGRGNAKRFSSSKEALAAYRRGEIGLNTVVELPD